MASKKKIDRENVEDIISLYHVQEGMLYHYIYEENTNIYLQQVSMLLKGKFDIKLFNKAWNIVVDNNEILRTIIRWEGIKEPVQVILKKHESHIEYHDISNNEKKATHELLEGIKKSQWEKGIDITNETVRINVCKIYDNSYEVIFTYHHIILDGWSSGIIINELLQVYNDIYFEKYSYRISIKPKYRQFIEYTKKINESECEKYWKMYFQDFEAKTKIPQFKDTNRNKLQINSISEILGNKLNKVISKFAKLHGITEATLYYVAWGILLQIYSNSEDVVFGATVSGRAAKINGIENMVGLFINTLPLRIKNKDEETALDLLKRINKSFIESQEFVTTPLVKIKKQTNFKSEETFFDSIVVIENYPISNELKDNTKALNIKSFSNKEVTNFDLTLYINTFENTEMKFCYNAELYQYSYVKGMMQHYRTIIEEIIDKYDQGIDSIEILSEQEKNKLLYDFNNTEFQYPKDKTIYELFEEQVMKTPDEIALVFRNEKITYKQLNERANYLAHNLQRRGVKANSIVGVMINRSVDMIVALLGILKAGGAYLPISPQLPRERIEYMLKDSKVEIIVVDEDSRSIDSGEIQVVIINSNLIIKEELDNLNPNSNSESSDLAYIIYTSGSTGKPKGVLIEHKQVVNFIFAMAEKIDLYIYKRFINITSISFDIFVLETFLPLLKGGQVIIADEETINDRMKLKYLIDTENVDVMQCTPSRIDILLCDDSFSLNNLKLLIIGGEEFKVNLINKLNKHKDLRIFNVYGPTETTVWSTVKEINLDDEINIGKPIGNTYIYIMNDRKCLLPIGSVGEIYIGGDGVSRGYLNREKLNNEKFIDNIFRAEEKMFRTGDLARWLPDGSIDYVGRIDNQVKIRGFRIEIGEVESNLLSAPQIRQAVVVAKENSDKDKYLCAYIVCDKNVKNSEIREWMLKSIPYYMIPSFFIKVDKIPLTNSGKIDRKLLPEPDKNAVTDNEYTEPNNEMERHLESIWRDVLKKNKVGVNDNFFELGGDSITAMKVINKVNKEFNLKFNISDLFKSVTIREFNQLIESYDEKQCKVINDLNTAELKVIGDSSSYEVSSSQKRLYILNQIQKQDISYNIFDAMVVNGEVDLYKVQKALDILLVRHESLRTYFQYIDDKVIQKVSSIGSVGIDLKVINKENKTENEIIDEFIRPFDLEKSPLIRVGISEIDKNKYLLIFDMAHIIADRISAKILIEEFIDIYDGRKLDELKYAYKDYAYFNNNLLKTEYVKKQKDYWINKFNGTIPKLNILTDYLRGKTSNTYGNQIYRYIDKETTSRLKDMSKETKTTLYMILLAAYNILLWRYTGQEDIVVGSPISGRTCSEVESIVGVFVNTLPMRNNPTSNKTFYSFLREVRQNTLEAYANSDVPFDELVNSINVDRELTRNPLFDNMFAFESIQIPKIDISNLEFEQYPYVRKASQFDFSITAEEDDDEIKLILEYSTGLFKYETMERFIEHYLNIVKDISKNEDKVLSDIKIISSEEENIILNKFNNKKLNVGDIKLVHEVIEDSVDKAPNDIAVVCMEQRLTYIEMESKANRLANYLRAKNVKREEPIIVLLERCADISLAFLGVLKSGAVFVPVDINSPKDRIKFILEDINSSFIITNEKTYNNKNLKAILDEDIHIVNLDSNELNESANNRPTLVNEVNDLAYIIYTSGSTGKPKGVMVQHSNLFNLGLIWREEYQLYKSKANVLQIASFSFDVFIGDMIRSWFNCGKLVICTDEEKLEVDTLYRKVHREEIGILESTPALVVPLMDYIYTNKLKVDSLKMLVLGSDICLAQDYKRLLLNFGDKMRIVNSYGLTETTIDSSYYEGYEDYSELNSLPIGKPLFNNEMYILDTEMKIQPIGIPGELFIGGVGVARGYWNNESLSNKKFINICLHEDIRLYRTGDIARWLPDGNVQFMGRNDHQVKIRGYRIELSEIEEILNKYEGINRAIVVVKNNNNGSKSLVACLKRDITEESLNIEKVKCYLLEKLPEYMLPSKLIIFDDFPLNQSGKIDRNKLIDIISVNYSTSNKVYPTTDLEKKIANVWSEILGIDDIGIDESFFELGGDSTLILKLYSKLKKDFDISAADLFSYHTIQMFIQHINRKHIDNRSMKEELLDILEELSSDSQSLRETQRRLEELEVNYENS